MRIVYWLDDFFKPCYPAVGAGVIWLVIIAIAVLVLLIIRRLLWPLFKRTWAWQIIDFCLFLHTFRYGYRHYERRVVEKCMQVVRDHMLYRVKKGRGPLIMEKYYLRLFEKAEKLYAEENNRSTD